MQTEKYLKWKDSEINLNKTKKEANYSTARLILQYLSKDTKKWKFSCMGNTH